RARPRSRRAGRSRSGGRDLGDDLPGLPVTWDERVGGAAHPRRRPRARHRAGADPGAVVEVALSAERQKLRWWSGRLTDVFRLEHPSCEADPTITRLRPFEIERQPWLRPLYERAGGYPWDLLAWEAQATGRFGILRLIAAFPAPPDQRPRVFCPDGPPAPDHRYDALELCLYYPDDPPERCWTLDQGLL